MSCNLLTESALEEGDNAAGWGSDRARSDFKVDDMLIGTGNFFRETV